MVKYWASEESNKDSSAPAMKRYSKDRIVRTPEADFGEYKSIITIITNQQCVILPKKIFDAYPTDFFGAAKTKRILLH